MPLSDYVYRVAATFKMTEQVEQWIYIKFSVKLEHSSVEISRMIQKATAMANWWLAASSRAEFLVKHQITQVTQPHYSPDLAPLTSGFSQNTNHLWKGRDFLLSLRFRKIWQGSWWRLGELCEVPRCLLWRGLRCHCPVYNVSCILYLQ